MSTTKWIILAALAYLVLSRRKDTLTPGRNYGRLASALAPVNNPPPISLPNAPLPAPPPGGETLHMGRSLKL